MILHSSSIIIGQAYHRHTRWFDLHSYLVASILLLSILALARESVFVCDFSTAMTDDRDTP